MTSCIDCKKDYCYNKNCEYFQERRKKARDLALTRPDPEYTQWVLSQIFNSLIKQIKEGKEK